MFQLNTERLKLIPLDAENYRLYVENPNAMEINLGLKVTNTVIDEPVKRAHKYRQGKVLENRDNYLWETNWVVVLENENRNIAGIMIKGMPNEAGEVIIGYGTDEPYQNKGYMTEAIKELIKWIFENPKALSVVADTDKNNISSHRVLEKNGFVKYRETKTTTPEGDLEELVWWRLDKVKVESSEV